MNWQVHIPKNIRKQIKKFPAHDHIYIAQALRDIAFNPWGGDIAKISGKDDSWRRRVGNYRIFYSLKKEIQLVEIKNIKRRTSHTY